MIRGSLGGERRVVRAALAVSAVAVVALVLVAHEVSRGSASVSLLSRGSQKELERLEHDTFESPDSTYDKALAQLRSAKVSQGAAMEAADAWASPSWPQPPKMTAAHRSVLPDLEQRIAADVSQTLAKTVAQEVAKAMATSHMTPQQKELQRKKEEQAARLQRRERQEKEKRARAQQKLLREVSQQVLPVWGRVGCCCCCCVFPCLCLFAHTYVVTGRSGAGGCGRRKDEQGQESAAGERGRVKLCMKKRGNAC